MSIIKLPNGHILVKDDAKEARTTAAAANVASAKGKKAANLTAKEKEDLLIALAQLSGLIDGQGNIL